MATTSISRAQRQQILDAVKYFESNRDNFEQLVKVLYVQLSENRILRPLIHSVKFRVKDPGHLKDKLVRQAHDAKKYGKAFTVSARNLFSTIGDLAGLRILHLHTRQMAEIHPAILHVFQEQRYRLVEKPVANTWDDEYRDFFRGLGIRTVARDSMYTSVHYVVEANSTKKLRCELQVRTLMEEVWGEVSHTINYPHPTRSVACVEQIKVLARVASGSTRLVDSIFRSHEEFAKFADLRKR
jgi:ppGpp synthetase/RelA/SpoT-type nucleotidyltranferase